MDEEEDVAERLCKLNILSLKMVMQYRIYEVILHAPAAKCETAYRGGIKIYDIFI